MSSPMVHVPSPNDVFGPAGAAAASTVCTVIPPDEAAGSFPNVDASTPLGTPGRADVADVFDGLDEPPPLPVEPMTMNSSTTPPTTHGHFRFFCGAGGGTGWP